MEQKTIGGYPFILYTPPQLNPDEAIERAKSFHLWIETRRSVRDFSTKEIPESVIRSIILSASSAPSGAHKQPWTFCVVSDPILKKKIREAAEKEEYESYNNRMSEEWLEAIRPLQTNWEKPFLEEAPYLIVVFKKVYDLEPEGRKSNNYYVSESVGLACGFLLAAIHQAGLVALTHTPSPMNFLCEILKRPDNERPFLLIPVGFPKDETFVPDLRRKEFDEITVMYNAQ